MKAVVFTEYGQPDVLQLKEVAKPTPKDNEVLVKIHAASVNSWDWELLRGTPFANRIMFGLLKPRIRILGCDIAGQVEAVGISANKYKPGDEVFGDISGCGWGGFAEYVSVPESALTSKPAGMTFEDAAAVPQAGLLALQGLRNKGEIQPGQKVLINGAGGGAGTFAVQIAKSFGAEVTGVDSTAKLDTMRSIGADRVIDYTKQDFTKNGQRYDHILDFAAYHSIFDYSRALSPGGTYVLVGGSSSRVRQVMFLGPFFSTTARKKLGLLIHKANKDLDVMTGLLEAGKVKPVIDKRYPLSEVAEALRYFGEGQARGKLVITVA
jgi:NADPH:quinone reductase-like Zn-dependent oxidoreductase